MIVLKEIKFGEKQSVIINVAQLSYVYFIDAPDDKIIVRFKLQNEENLDCSVSGVSAQELIKAVREQLKSEDTDIIWTPKG
jgi:hypothetical protein